MMAAAARQLTAQEFVFAAQDIESGMGLFGIICREQK